MIEQTWQDVQDLCADVWEWVCDHAVDIFFGAMLVVIFVAMYALLDRLATYRQSQIELCVRAFEYTHDQCEFIVRNRLTVIK